MLNQERAVTAPSCLLARPLSVAARAAIFAAVFSAGVQGFASPSAGLAQHGVRAQTHGARCAVMQAQPEPRSGHSARRGVLLGAASLTLGLAGRPALASADVMEENLIELAARDGVESMLSSMVRGASKTEVRSRVKVRMCN